MKDLTSLRSDLKTLNAEFFLFLNQRKELVTTIQSIKETTTQYYCFDPDFEFSLFSLNSDVLSKLSIKELLSYSLILEDHALVDENSYPEWTQLVHLSEKSHELYFRINPILLAVIHKNLYDQLPLNDEFKSMLEKHVN